MRPKLVHELKLNVDRAFDRLEPRVLHEYAEEHDIDLCLLLPTARSDKVIEENRRFIGFTRKYSRLRTLATLHPLMSNAEEEIRFVLDSGVPGFKFSSFSQKFDICSPEFAFLLEKVERIGNICKTSPVLVFDTFDKGVEFFGADPEHITSPKKLSILVQSHPGLRFLAAHMGGLMHDFDRMRRDLAPASNLFLDTSNAAHTLTEDQFTELLRSFGAHHVLFGTDWPWFDATSERVRIGGLMRKADYSQDEQDSVLGGNALRLFGFEL
ncbi:amidohydrolase family protein [Desulfomonile tiedjei]|nr:amidohydrolase family protein [Desulfomonile tiedjei]